MAQGDEGAVYGYRARIGYTCPPVIAEVFPYEFYKVVPEGVTLAITTLAVLNATPDELQNSYDISLQAAKEMGRRRRGPGGPGRSARQHGPGL